MDLPFERLYATKAIAYTQSSNIVFFSLLFVQLLKQLCSVPPEVIDTSCRVFVTEKY
jgi:hypothetical protein